MVTYNGKQYANWTEARADQAKPAVEAPPAPEPGPLLASPAATPAAPATPGDKRRALTDKFRPRSLADLKGQPEVVRALADFVANPYPCAFLLAGETGTGKTSAATALAVELGCNVDQAEFGGVYSVPSGENTPAVLNELWPLLYTMPFASSRGWKVVIVNEVENLNGKVELLWLDRLEELPPQTVVVFTTNKVETLPSRFVDRCIGGVMEFLSTVDDLGNAARELARQIWRDETGAEIAADTLERVITRSTREGMISFRRVVQHLTPLVAAAKAVKQ